MSRRKVHTNNLPYSELTPAFSHAAQPMTNMRRPFFPLNRPCNHEVPSHKGVSSNVIVRRLLIILPNTRVIIEVSSRQGSRSSVLSHTLTSEVFSWETLLESLAVGSGDD